MENTSTDVLWENEVNANRVMVWAATITAVIYGFFWLLTAIEAIYVDQLHMPHVVYLFLILAMLIPSGIAMHFHCQKKWIKYMMMLGFILTFMVADIIYTEYIQFLMVIPVVLASRYFSTKYTIFTTICTDVAFFISAILGVYYGTVPVSCLELPAGTVIDMGEYTWVSDVVNEGLVYYDKGLLLKNVLLYSYLVKLLLSLIVAVACVVISYQGRRIIFRQKELTEHTARIETELSTAKNIQMNSLPSVFPPFPERSEIDIFAYSTPAKEVGGDFYDFFFIDDDHLCLLIADVSGKGIPAALFMMSSKIIIAQQATPGKTPGQILTDANNAICVNNREMMFVTVWLGILEISTGKLMAANGGHEKPAISSGGNSFSLYEDKHGMFLGVVKGKKYEDYELVLLPGDKIFLYTDGVAEASTATRELFGMDRMISALNKDLDASPEQILNNINTAVSEFVEEADQFDDITMLCLRYNGT